MSKIAVLDQNTINQIAAGEVVERPASVVKELIENAIDAGANAITAEIKEGGINFIRITDNGAGIDKNDIPVAFLRHSTSKIRSVEDLLTIGSLGFRGEALSSIASVAQVELVTKTRSYFIGTRYVIEGGEEKEIAEIGCPEGTTFIIRNLFYNTPARRKFLKSPMTEAGYVNDLLERLAVSHPNISFKFINNNKTLLHTSGNRNLKDIIYHIYGRDIAAQLLAVAEQREQVTMEGYIGKPIVSRGNRNFENYFINGRYIKSNIITKAIEEAYKPYSMQHNYPFTSIHFTIDPELIDVNVHPTKMEIRFTNAEYIYRFVYETLSNALAGKNMIPDVRFENDKKPEKKVYENIPEPFEANRRSQIREELRNKAERKREEAILEMSTSNLFSGKQENSIEIIKDTEIMKLHEAVKNASLLNKEQTQLEQNNYGQNSQGEKIREGIFNDQLYTNRETIDKETIGKETADSTQCVNNPIQLKSEVDSQYIKESEEYTANAYVSKEKADKLQHSDNNQVEKESLSASNAENFEQLKSTAVQQMKLAEVFSSESAKPTHRIIGQLFSTYWLVEYEMQLYIIDQHAAHEKILYERTIKRIREEEFLSQLISPPIVLTLNLKEAAAVTDYMDSLKHLGFEIEHFGGKEYSVSALPADMYGIAGERLLVEFIDDLVEEIPKGTPDVILEKIASMSCKAAVKGNQKMSYVEAEALIAELLKLDNPFHCPHGRPIIISMTKYELEKKFKRII